MKNIANTQIFGNSDRTGTKGGFAGTALSVIFKDESCFLVARHNAWLSALNVNVSSPQSKASENFCIYLIFNHCSAYVLAILPFLSVVIGQYVFAREYASTLKMAITLPV
jgi:hypothetical protein